jgi:tetrahydrodipicolinate N-succinyltransferase
VSVGAAEIVGTGVDVGAGVVTGIELQAVKREAIISKERRTIHILPAVTKLLLINPL